MKISEIIMGGNKARPERMRPARKVQQDFVKKEITENSSIGKNKHIEHIEDEIINDGISGLKTAIDTLSAVYSMLSGTGAEGYSISEKWDGAPAIICGKDPDSGNFVMGDKGIFSTRSNNKIFSPEDIDRIKPNKEIDGQMVSYDGLRSKLKTIFPLLSTMKTQGIIQGDVMFTRDDLKVDNINGKKYITFRPNTITYAVPFESELARTISSSNAGMVFHTKYTGGIDLATMKASYGFNSSELPRVQGLWTTDANIDGLLKNIKINQNVSNQVNTALNLLTKVMDSMHEDTLSLGDDTAAELKSYINYMIREYGQFEQDLSKFSKDFIQWNSGRPKNVDVDANKVAYLYNVYLAVMRIKLALLSQLRSVKLLDTFIQNNDGSYTPTACEGYVVVDQFGVARKLVNRIEFSRLNFILPKNWK
jgi:ASC-1-like (ASCH) protein